MKRAPKLSLVIADIAQPTLADRLSARAYRPVYRLGEVNHCPGCGRSNWWIRSTAECAFCGAVLPLADNGRRLEEAT